MAGEPRESVIGREEAYELAQALEDLDVPERVKRLARRNYARWVIVDNGIACAVLDSRRGVSTTEMLRRATARGTALKQRRQRTAGPGVE